MDAEQVIAMHNGEVAGYESMERDRPHPEGEEAPPEPKKPGPIYVSKEDLLASENMHLKALLMGKEIEEIHQLIQKKMTEHQELEAKLRVRRQELEAKYGIDLLTHYIRESDGLVIPRPQQGTLQGILGQQIKPPPPAANGGG